MKLYNLTLEELRYKLRSKCVQIKKEIPRFSKDEYYFYDHNYGGLNIYDDNGGSAHIPNSIVDEFIVFPDGS